MFYQSSVALMSILNEIFIWNIFNEKEKKMKTDKRSKVMGDILLPEYKTNARLVHGVMFFVFFQ